MRVGHAERDCLQFIQHEPGMSPMEHEEMRLLQEVDARNRKAREDDIERNKQWREEEIKRTAEWKAKEHADGERRHGEQLEWQKQVETNVASRFSKAEAGTESRHGRTIGIGFMQILLTAALTGGGFALVQWALKTFH
jgi:hypothetical protein